MSTTSTPEGIASLASKIVSVMGALPRVQKSGRNDFHKYDYATESDIMEVVSRACAEHRLAILPSVVDHTEKELEQGRRKSRLVTVQMDVTFVCADTGASMTTRWVGEGMDDGDKAFYKAYTGAMKYALAKTFQISFGDDPENDAQEQPEPTRDTRPAPRKPEQKQTKKAAPAKTQSYAERKYASPGDAAQVLQQEIDSMMGRVAKDKFGSTTNEDASKLFANVQPEIEDLLCKKLEVAQLKHAKVEVLATTIRWIKSIITGKDFDAKINSLRGAVNNTQQAA